MALITSRIKPTRAAFLADIMTGPSFCRNYVPYLVLSSFLVEQSLTCLELPPSRPSISPAKAMRGFAAVGPSMAGCLENPHRGAQEFIQGGIVPGLANLTGTGESIALLLR
jgi:hypothetical protein